MTSRQAGFSWLGRAGLLFAVLTATGLPATEAAAKPIRVGGTGMAIGLMSGIADQLRARDRAFSVDVLPSMGTRGGLRALADGVIDVATAGRDLAPAELALGMREAACARTPLAFVTSHPAPNGVRRSELPRIFSDPGATWADGSPIKVILRAKSGSELPYLAAAVPGLGEAFESAARRQGMVVGATDQENAEFATRIQGSFAVMTVLQIRSEKLPLQPVPLDGVVPSAETLADGTYPFAMRVCLILPAEPSPGAQQLVRQFGSPEGHALLRRLGAEPSE